MYLLSSCFAVFAPSRDSLLQVPVKNNLPEPKSKSSKRNRTAAQQQAANGAQEKPETEKKESKGEAIWRAWKESKVAKAMLEAQEARQARLPRALAFRLNSILRGCTPHHRDVPWQLLDFLQTLSEEFLLVLPLRSCLVLLAST